MPPEQYSGSRVLNTDPREQRQEYYEGSGIMQGGGEKIRTVQPRPRRRGLWILLAILLIIFLIGGGLSTVLAGSTFVSSTTAQPAQTFIVAGTPNLHIEDSTGTIRIHRGQTNSVIIQPTLHYSGFGVPPSKVV